MNRLLIYAVIAAIVLSLLSTAADAKSRRGRRGAEQQHPLRPLRGGEKSKKTKQPAPGCEPTDISQNLPRGFEPSDSVWANGTLVLVSDDSRLLAMDKDGNNVRQVWIGKRKKYDFEALAFVPGRPGFLYLGVEEPPRILEFGIETLKRTGRSWDLSGAFEDLPENAGMEALAFVKTNRSRSGGYFGSFNQLRDLSDSPLIFWSLALPWFLAHFLVAHFHAVAGCQHDARLFMFDIDLTANPPKPPVLVAVIRDHPGPNYDISSLQIHKKQLFLLFDKAMMMIQIDLTYHEKLLLPRTNPPVDPSVLPYHISAKNATHAHYEFTTRGQEGVSFSDEHAFFSIGALSE